MVSNLFIDLVDVQVLVGLFAVGGGGGGDAGRRWAGDGHGIS